MTDHEPPDEHPPKVDTALLTAALDHSWAWYDGRTKRAFEVINYYLVAAAILFAAYTSAIDGKNYGLATALAIAGLGLNALALLGGLQEIRAARLAKDPLMELQKQIADRLSIPSISMAGEQRVEVERRDAGERAWIGPGRPTFIIALGFATLGNIIALLYALIH